MSRADSVSIIATTYIEKKPPEMFGPRVTFSGRDPYHEREFIWATPASYARLIRCMKNWTLLDARASHIYEDGAMISLIYDRDVTIVNGDPDKSLLEGTWSQRISRIDQALARIDWQVTEMQREKKKKKYAEALYFVRTELSRLGKDIFLLMGLI